LKNSFECLQNRSPRVLQQANQRETDRAEYGTFTFGPAVDGKYIPDLPGRQLLHGKYAKNITILQGHNEYSRQRLSNIRDEGLIFVDPMLTMASERYARMKLRKHLPLATLETLWKIRDMYPSPSSSNGEFAHQFDRVNALISGSFHYNINFRMDFQL
jgi:Carboxylesterase family